MTPDEAWAALWKAVGSGEPYSGIELRRAIEAAIRAEPPERARRWPDLCPDCGHHIHRPDSCTWTFGAGSNAYPCPCPREAAIRAEPLDVAVRHWARLVVDTKPHTNARARAVDALRAALAALGETQS